MRRYPFWRLALSWAAVAAVVLWAAACTIPVRAVSGMLLTLCLTPVGIVVTMSDGSQVFRPVEQLGPKDERLLQDLPDDRRYRLEVCR